MPFSPRVSQLLFFQVLDVSGNLIEADSLPVHVAALKKLRVLRLEDNPCCTWQSDPQAPSASIAHMRALGEERIPCDFLKMIVIGQEAVGKTTLVDTL